MAPRGGDRVWTRFACMAFDLNRALSLGRRAVRLIGALRDDDARRFRGAGRRAGGTAPFPGPPGPPGRAWDPTVPTDSWPMPGRGPRARGDGRASTSSATDPRGRPLLADFTGAARVEYAPVPGPAAGPGEVVWTWVPYEEMDGRGKDRPVLLVGRDGDLLLGLMLTSRDRNNARARDEDYVDVGSGPWDRAGRPSEAKLDRVLRVDPAAVRREGGVLDPAAFERVGDALARAQGWRR